MTPPVPGLPPPLCRARTSSGYVAYDWGLTLERLPAPRLDEFLGPSTTWSFRGLRLALLDPEGVALCGRGDQRRPVDQRVASVSTVASSFADARNEDRQRRRARRAYADTAAGTATKRRRTTAPRPVSSRPGARGDGVTIVRAGAIAVERRQVRGDALVTLGSFPSSHLRLSRRGLSRKVRRVTSTPGRQSSPRSNISHNGSKATACRRNATELARPPQYRRLRSVRQSGRVRHATAFLRSPAPTGRLAAGERVATS
jgi:hypothetical protein